MATRQVVIDVPKKILLAEKTDEIGLSRENGLWVHQKKWGRFYFLRTRDGC